MSKRTRFTGFIARITYRLRLYVHDLLMLPTRVAITHFDARINNQSVWELRDDVLALAEAVKALTVDHRLHDDAVFMAGQDDIKHLDERLDTIERQLEAVDCAVFQLQVSHDMDSIADDDVPDVRQDELIAHLTSPTT